MKSDRPFRKSFACAGVLYGVIVVILIASGPQNLSYRLGYELSTCALPALASGIWGNFSKRSWSWFRFAVTVLGFFVLFGGIIILGPHQD